MEFNDYPWKLNPTEVNFVELDEEMHGTDSGHLPSSFLVVCVEGVCLVIDPDFRDYISVSNSSTYCWNLVALFLRTSIA